MTFIAANAASCQEENQKHEVESQPDSEEDEEASTPFLQGNRNTSERKNSSEELSGKSQRISSCSATKNKLIGFCSAGLLLAGIVAVSVVTVFHHGVSKGFGEIETDRIFTFDDAPSESHFKRDVTEGTSDDTYAKSDKSWKKYETETNSEPNSILSDEEVPVTQTHVFYDVDKPSPDGKWELVANNTKQLYRRSFYADYYVKNLKTKVTKRITPPTKDGTQIRYCRWSSRGDAIVFVYGCNIYYIATASSITDGHPKYYKLTSSGIPGKVFNGVPDWVYEEEIIESNPAIEFSSDGQFMSFVTFNATLVPFYKFPMYGPQSNGYPDIEQIAYPKAGFPNPTVEITVVDLKVAMAQLKSTKSRNHIIAPSKVTTGDYYYAMMKFNGFSQLFVQWLDRRQTLSVCVIYDMHRSNGRITEQHQVQHGWVDDKYVYPKWAKDGSYYITLLPRSHGSAGDFRHVAKVSVINHGIEFLTGGTFTVSNLVCWNAEKEMIYFKSNEKFVRGRQVYRYNLKTKTKECVSCGLIKDKDGNPCTFHEATFNTHCTQMSLSCRGPFSSRSVQVDLDSFIRSVLISDAIPNEHLPLYYTVKSDGFDIHVKEWRPINFSPHRKYAVLFNVYGGPGYFQLTDDKNNINGFDREFMTNYDCIIIHLDARGSGNYGYKFMHAVYRNLGHYEARDVIAVAKHLRNQNHVDADRIGIWGWSFGGFLSSTVLAVSDGIFSTGVSVAPVTDWRYYDTAYTERYMGIPSAEDNLKGYQDTSVMSKANNFKGKNFFLIHGTADDNVHFQNSAQLVAALIRAQVTHFKTQFYPDRDHAIHSGGHVYKMIANYLVEGLKLHRS